MDKMIIDFTPRNRHSLILLLGKWTKELATVLAETSTQKEEAKKKSHKWCHLFRKLLSRNAMLPPPFLQLSKLFSFNAESF